MHGGFSKVTFPEKIDLLVRGRVVTMDNARRVIDTGGVAVRDGRIIEVNDFPTLLNKYRAKETAGHASAIVMPGFIDGHTHCTQCFVRALTSGELPMIPRIYSPAQRSLGSHQAGWTVKLLAAQLLCAGITTLSEGTLNPDHEDAIVEAIHEVGIRCSLARGSSDQDFHHASLYSQIKDQSWIRPRPADTERDLAHTEGFLKRFPARGDGLIRGAVNTSALVSFSESYFKESAKIARSNDATIQVHIGRDREEVEFSLAMWGRRPIERLVDMGVVDEHLVAVHAVLVSEREVELLAEGGAALAHTPLECVANLNAIPNIPRMRSRGIRMCLGCDNQANDMFVAMRAAWLIHGTKWGLPAYDPEFLSADELLSMATIEGASALRMNDMIGSLEAGKAADMVVLDGASPHFMGMQHLSSELVRYGSRGEVQQTIVAGRILYNRGEFPTIDMAKLFEAARKGADFVRSAVESRRYRPLPRF